MANNDVLGRSIRRVHLNWREQLRARSPYLLAAGLTFLISLGLLQPWAMSANDVFSAGEDIVALQTTVTAVSQTGPFGTNPHLAYPIGSNPWAFPQLGLAVLVCAWVLGGLFGLSSGAATLWIFIAALVATAVSTLYLVRTFIGRQLPWLAATLCAAIAVSPFFLVKIGHLNIAVFYLVPLVLAVLIRGINRDRRWRLWAGIGVFIATAIASLWWVTVMLLLVPVLMIAIALQRNWRALRWSFVVALALAAGASVQMILFHSAQIPGAALGRSTWGANAFSGKLTDLVLASPLLNSFMPTKKFDLLRTGASVEYKPLGIVCAFLVVALLLLTIKVLPRYVDRSVQSQVSRTDTTLLASLSVIAILFYLTGGLGNAQAALAVLAGSGSPARGFSRFAIIMAIVGLVWVLLYLCRYVSQRLMNRRALLTFQAVLSILILAFALLDLNSLGAPATLPKQSLPEYESVEYLRSKTEPCPVAQLPQEGAPIPLAIMATTTDAQRAEVEREIYYRGYYPYLIAPDYFWSIGSYVRSQAETNAITRLGTTLTGAGLASLKQAGFCAVLYDEKLAEVPKAEKLAGVKRAEDLPAPALRSNRYDLYLLN